MRKEVFILDLRMKLSSKLVMSEDLPKEEIC